MNKKLMAIGLIMVGLGSLSLFGAQRREAHVDDPMDGMACHEEISADSQPFYTTAFDPEEVSTCYPLGIDECSLFAPSAFGTASSSERMSLGDFPSSSSAGWHAPSGDPFGDAHVVSPECGGPIVPFRSFVMSEDIIRYPTIDGV